MTRVFSSRDALLPSYIKKLLKQEKAKLDEGKWNQFKMGEICFILREWECQEIWLNNNESQTLLKEISQVRFPSLKKIILYNNKICSIESLSRIFFPNLDCLSLGWNYINIGCQLKKCVWNNLLALGINSNPLIDNSVLVHLVNIEFEQLLLEWWDMGGLEREDCRWLFKMKASKIGKLYILRQYRICESIFLSTLKKKYMGIKAYKYK